MSLEVPLLKAAFDLVSELFKRLTARWRARDNEKRAAQLVSEAMRELMGLRANLNRAAVLIRQAELLLSQPSEDLERAKAMLAQTERASRARFSALSAHLSTLDRLDSFLHVEKNPLWAENPTQFMALLLQEFAHLLDDDLNSLHGAGIQAERLELLKKLLIDWTRRSLLVFYSARFVSTPFHGLINYEDRSIVLEIGQPPSSDSTGLREYAWTLVNWATLFIAWNGALRSDDSLSGLTPDERRWLDERESFRRNQWQNGIANATRQNAS